MAASAVLCLGLVALTVVVLHGRAKNSQELVSGASVAAFPSPSAPYIAAAVSPEPSTETAAAAEPSAPAATPVAAPTADENSAVRKDEAKKEDAKTGHAPKDQSKNVIAAPPLASRPVDDIPSRPGRNPHETSTPLSGRPSPTPLTGTDQNGEGACLALVVTGSAGLPVGHAHITVTDGPKSFSTFTGLLGRGRVCGLTSGHRVTVNIVGPAGRRSATREVSLGTGRNVVDVEIEP